MTDTPGVTAEDIRFFEDLAENNTREFWTAHEDVFERQVGLGELHDPAYLLGTAVLERDFRLDAGAVRRGQDLQTSAKGLHPIHESA